MNKMNKVKLFIEAWDKGYIQNNSIKKYINKSSIGNININGDYYSDKSILLTKNDDAFYDAIEEHVKCLVSILINRFNWITYSSCQGHPSYNGIAYKKRVIQLLPRNNIENDNIFMKLNRAKNETNNFLCNKNKKNINILVLKEILESKDELEKYQTIKIVFDNNRLQEKEYFKQLNDATHIFIQKLEQLGKLYEIHDG